MMPMTDITTMNQLHADRTARLSIRSVIRRPRIARTPRRADPAPALRPATTC
jgi:hypothetical protein